MFDSLDILHGHTFLFAFGVPNTSVSSKIATLKSTKTLSVRQSIQFIIFQDSHLVLLFHNTVKFYSIKINLSNLVKIVQFLFNKKCMLIVVIAVVYPHQKE